MSASKAATERRRAARRALISAATCSRNQEPLRGDTSDLVRDVAMLMRNAGRTPGPALLTMSDYQLKEIFFYLRNF
jgi:hypothetical protein